MMPYGVGTRGIETKAEDIPDDLNDNCFIAFEFFPYTETQVILGMRDRIENESWKAWFDLTYSNTIRMNFENINGKEPIDVGIVREYADKIQEMEAL